MWLGNSLGERDLGDNYKLNMSRQCTTATTKANWILDCILRDITKRDRHIIDSPPLYLPLIRLHLEYCVQFWCLQFKKGADKERVQKRATKLIKRLENLSSEERLKKLGLCTLEKTRFRTEPHHSFHYLKGSYRGRSLSSQAAT